jgi:8-oxo-dGTP pyrophosphatase MutT (NUDIX family)
VHVLNLHDDFAEQVSAGGIPVWFGPEGPEFALIQVHRRSGNSWEVAKGKLELGEPPMEAAIREVREEMGCPMELEVLRSLGYVRYGFFTPEGHPRLKTLHMYLLRTPERVGDFAPADREGVRAVGWFTPRQAVRIVPHRSLRPLMRRLRRLLSGQDEGPDGPTG